GLTEPLPCRCAARRRQDKAKGHSRGGAARNLPDRNSRPYAGQASRARETDPQHLTRRRTPDHDDIEAGAPDMLHKHFLAFAICCALAAPAFASEPINAHAAINPDGKLDVKNVRGTVHITPWDRNEVEVTGSVGEGSKFFLDGS